RRKQWPRAGSADIRAVPGATSRAKCIATNAAPRAADAAAKAVRSRAASKRSRSVSQKRARKGRKSRGRNRREPSFCRAATCLNRDGDVAGQAFFPPIELNLAVQLGEHARDGTRAEAFLAWRS